MDELVAIARITKPRGLKGEVVADILTDFPDRFAGLTTVTAIAGSGEIRELIIESHWFQSGRIVLKFENVDSLESAETLRNTEICVFESQVVELEKGEYFDWELTGCRVEKLNGEVVGTVRELMRTGGTELLVVDGIKEYLIPFAETICIDVDIRNKIIRIDPPDGLLEF